MSKGYLEALQNIVFPRGCFFCGRKIQAGYLCPSCRQAIDFLPPAVCRFCAKPLKENRAACSACQETAYPYERLISAASYKEPLITLIHCFKYKNCDYLAQPLAALMLRRAKLFNLSGYDLVTAVGLHPAKLKVRGYNQASLLAKNLANHFKIPFIDDIIYERSERPSQTRLNKVRRAENIKGAFCVKKDIAGKRIIVVDDIFTTGSTLKECARVLKEKGAEKITAVTLAKRLL